jgi:hypothetical protein
VAGLVASHKASWRYASKHRNRITSLHSPILQGEDFRGLYRSRAALVHMHRLAQAMPSSWRSRRLAGARLTASSTMPSLPTQSLARIRQVSHAGDCSSFGLPHQHLRRPIKASILINSLPSCAVSRSQKIFILCLLRRAPPSLSRPSCLFGSFHPCLRVSRLATVHQVTPIPKRMDSTLPRRQASDSGHR